MSTRTVLSVDVRTEPSLVETNIEFLGKKFKLVQITVADPAEIQEAIEQYREGAETAAAIGVSGIDLTDLSLSAPATSGQDLSTIRNP